MSLKNHPDLFPQLRQTTLRKHADIWSKQYDYLESIVLYKAPSSAPYGKKYVLVFKLPEIKSNNKDLKGRISILLDMFQHFNSSIPEIDENFFKEVCKKGYEESFRNEWLFRTDTPTDVIEQYSWVLYPSKTQLHRF